MKNILLRYGLLSISFIIITEITNKIINLKDLLHHFLIDFLSVDQINSYFEFQDKWHWLIYLYIPLIILIKTSVISLIIYIGLFLLSKETKYNQLWNATIKAEFIFLLVPIFKIIWFYFFQPNYDLNDIQNYYPLSALNIIGYKGLEAWFIYPFQVLNLFEFVYVIYLGFEIGKLTNTNTDYGLKIVGISYVPSLVLWVATVMFFTLNYS
ncbi:hypothetical protein [Flavobacterium sp. F52]|uniref:hypothetical protein n=1 Tax=Flavobacterium sp. F52 TaxID=1202532 RepID=UPI000272E7A7|nr:hypothetical protein [Flavobacterium sp. F52]EJG01344.1 hypothetical protein FF52_09808 [Flavobacterium sp. F52]